MDHQQRVEFYDALIDAFALDLPGLVRMLVHRAKWPPGDIPAVAGQKPANVVFEITQYAQMHGVEPRLLEAALDARPSNAKLRALAQSLNFGVLSPPDAKALEREVTRGLPNVPIGVWREQLGRIEGWVCRIEIPATTREGEGTGFLIGPDLVVTAQHVVEEVIDGTYPPTDVRIRFDFRATTSGTRVREGTLVGLNTSGDTQYPNAEGTMQSSWLVDSAPPSPVDLMVNPGDQLPELTALDFALLRLAEPIGRRPINPAATSDATETPRGWLTVPTTETGLNPPGSVLIVQHPRARPMELALGANGLIGLNKNRTRLRYRTNTEHGSSGSPCFDLNWNLLALHHVGDPDYSLAHTPEWNQGIPFHLIAARLKLAGFGSLLNESL